MRKKTLKSLGERCKFGVNELPDAHLRLCICDACGIHNVMPINHQTLYMECMGCGHWIILTTERGV
jgi:hypothetical protein